MPQHKQVMLVGISNNNAQIKRSFMVKMPQQHKGITSLTMLYENIPSFPLQ